MLEFQAGMSRILSSLLLTILNIKSHVHSLEGNYNIFKIKRDKLGNDTIKDNHV